MYWLLVVTPAEGQMEITWKNNPFITNVNININHSGSNSVSKTEKNDDNNNNNKKPHKHTLVERQTNQGTQATCGLANKHIH